MKKFYCHILIVVCMCPAFLLIAACNRDSCSNDEYITDNKHCIVSLPQGYDISFKNCQTTVLFDKELHNAKIVNGKEKKDDFIYYKVSKNEPFRILTPLAIIGNKNESRQTLVYWKLNDALYKDGDSEYSENTFVCTTDTEITPVYYEFRPVGMLLRKADRSGMPTVQYDSIFDNRGEIKEQDDVYYLYGVYDFEPYQKFWCTNLTIKKHEINHTVKSVAENYNENFYTINIEIDKNNLFYKGIIIVDKLYKIDGHGYMIYGASEVIHSNHSNVINTLPIGIHEIKYTID